MDTDLVSLAFEPAIVASVSASNGVGTDSEMWCVVSDTLPELGAAIAWAGTPRIGAVVTFSGLVRDHAPGFDNVSAITYEAFDSEALRRMKQIAVLARQRDRDVGRVAIWHRTGLVALGEPSIDVVVSAEHRGPAFEAARFCIDVAKACLPVWKWEHAEAGFGWTESGVEAMSVEDAAAQWQRC